MATASFFLSKIRYLNYSVSSFDDYEENVYKSRARLSSNVTRTKNGLTVEITLSQELSDEIIKELKKKKSADGICTIRRLM